LFAAAIAEVLVSVKVLDLTLSSVAAAVVVAESSFSKAGVVFAVSVFFKSDISFSFQYSGLFPDGTADMAERLYCNRLSLFWQGS